MDSGIYVWVSPSNRCYIGSTNNFERRRKKHLYDMKRDRHPCDALQAAWNKYGDNLTFMVIERCEVGILIQREQWWIDSHRQFWGRMYNSSGIAGRPEHTTEVRRKISESKKGRKLTLEHIEKVRLTSTGRKHSDEAKRKIGAASARPEMVARFVAANKGRVKSQDEIDRVRQMGVSHKGKKHTDATREKMALAQQKRYASNPYPEAAKAKLRGPRGPKSDEAKQKMRNSWTAERKAKYTEMVREQRLREHMERLNWMLEGMWEPRQPLLL